MKKNTPAIESLRNEIDQIDEQILKLINRRLSLAQQIGEIKQHSGAQVFDSARESLVIKRLLEINEGGMLNNNMLQHLFTEIMAAAKAVQKPQVISFLGPEATFTHIAAMNHFGHSADFKARPSIRDVFSDVEKGACNYGVVPVENSIEGAVNHTLDLFFESNLNICAERFLSISHDLLSVSGRKEDIIYVYSHPQALAQCRGWLHSHLPGIELKECSSTAHAARMAAQNEDSAAIASREAAHMYGLQVVVPKIEDYKRNVTRFLVIGKGDVQPTGTDKTSLMFVTAHQPGALYKVLTPIAESGVNMLKLESRPAKHENWSYFFFVDVQGHITDKPVAQIVEEMRRRSLFLKVLGAYPKAPDQIM